MNNLCCISLTLATRLIGTFGLSTSILMINVLMGEFFAFQRPRDGKDLSVSVMDAWVVLGLKWTPISKHPRDGTQTEIILISFLIFSVLFLLASALLVSASFNKKKRYTVPWMFLQFVSITDQSVALMVNLTNESTESFDNSTWYLPIASTYLVMSVYFWMIIYAARKEWHSHLLLPESSHFVQSLSNSISTETASPTKSPSVLTQNNSIFTTPRPAILPKYDEI